MPGKEPHPDYSLPESTTHTFIIKIRLEEASEEGGSPTWRGHITHVLTGKRRYVQSIAEISAFITHYLAEMGVHV